MVRAPQAVDSRVDRAARVLRRADALEQERQRGQRPQPGQVIPRQPLIAEQQRPLAGGRLHILFRRHGEAAAEDRVAGVIGQAQALQLREARQRQVARPPAQCQGVQRDHDGRESGGLGPAHQAFAHLPVGGRVELEPPRSIAELGRHGLHRILRQRGGDHRDAHGGRGTRGCQVPVPVGGAQPDHSHGRQQQRRSQAPPEQLHRQVPLRRGGEHPRHQPPAVKGPHVRALGPFVPRAARDVRPHLRRHALLGLPFQFRVRHRQRRALAAQPVEIDTELPVTVVSHPPIQAHLARSRCHTPPTCLSWPAHSRWRRTNFWILPVDVLGSGPKVIASGHL